jgi:hypothetical protein
MILVTGISNFQTLGGVDEMVTSVVLLNTETQDIMEIAITPEMGINIIEFSNGGLPGNPSHMSQPQPVAGNVNGRGGQVPENKKSEEGWLPTVQEL